MQAPNRKILMTRHSGEEPISSSNRLYKASPRSQVRPYLAARRINTEAPEKKAKQSKYLFKKSKDDFKYSINSMTKEASTLNQKYTQWDKISFNQNEWMTNMEPRKTMTIKKSASRFTYGNKVKELERLIKARKESELRVDSIQNSQKKNKSKSRFVVDCETYINSRQQTQQKLRKSMDRTNQSIEMPPKYQILYDKLLGSGTFGKVYVGVCSQTGKNVAIKVFENDKMHKCREIQLMEMIESKFVIRIVDKFTSVERGKQNRKQIQHIVMPKYESSFFQFLKARNYCVEPNMLKVYLYQIFKGISHLHEKGICHRDLKPQNILISKNRLVICDLGSAKLLRKDEPNISYICSRCYRAPELIFGSAFYSFYIDIWSIGCIILEILNQGPFFIAKDSLHHLIQIMKVMGTPSKKQVLSMNPDYDISSFEEIPLINKKCWKDHLLIEDDLLFDLISKIMVYNPHKRLTAQQALNHPYFSEMKNQNFITSVASKIDCQQLLNSMQNVY